MRELKMDPGSSRALFPMVPTLPDLGTTLAPATPPKWTSNAILRVADPCIGQESDEVSIVIGG